MRNFAAFEKNLNLNATQFFAFEKNLNLNANFFLHLTFLNAKLIFFIFLAQAFNPTLDYIPGYLQKIN